MPVTTVDIDFEVLAKAKQAVGLTTTKEVVNYALAELAARVERRQAFERLLDAEHLDAFQDPAFREEARG
jgi:Arc/MetJ family transcription regulator